jgi:hypothetical protein
VEGLDYASMYIFSSPFRISFDLVFASFTVTMPASIQI